MPRQIHRLGLAAAIALMASVVSSGQTAAVVPVPVSIYAAGPGSGFLPYARGLSGFLRSAGIDSRVVETAGSIENIRRLRVDAQSVATVFMGSAFEAYTGVGDWNDGTRFTDLRALFPMYETPVRPAITASMRWPS